MKTKKILSIPLALALLIIPFFSNAQITVTFKPGIDVGKDAQIADIEPNLNINDDKLSPYAWTHSSIPRIHRSLIEFTELATIPPNSVIVNAKLKLFFKTNHPATPSLHSGTNDLYVRRITSAWTETGVTWNTQPTTTSVNEVLVPPSSNNNQDYDIDVTNIVADLVAGNNYGFMLSLQNETPYRLALFASSDHASSPLHPEIEITYNYPTAIKENKLNAFSIYPNPVRNSFTIQAAQNNDLNTVEVLNSLGQTVLNKKIEGTTSIINVSNLSKGTYFVRVAAKDGLVSNSKKILVL